MTARFDKLRTSLRTGGWVGHARNLPSYVARNGIGCTRTLGELTLRFQVRTNDDGEQAVAYLVDRNSHRLVADERNVYLRREQAIPARRPAPPGEVVHIWMSGRVVERLRRLAKQTDQSQSAIVRRATDLYLKAREG